MWFSPLPLYIVTKLFSTVLLNIRVRIVVIKKNNRAYLLTAGVPFCFIVAAGQLAPQRSSTNSSSSPGSLVSTRTFTANIHLSILRKFWKHILIVFITSVILLILLLMWRSSVLRAHVDIGLLLCVVGKGDGAGFVLDDAWQISVVWIRDGCRFTEERRIVFLWRLKMDLQRNNTVAVWDGLRRL